MANHPKTLDRLGSARRFLRGSVVLLFTIVWLVTLAQPFSAQSRSCAPRTKITRHAGESASQLAVLSGTILDRQGAVIAGALVLITEKAMKTKRQTRSSDEGKFEFTALPEGEYSIKIESPGFCSYNKKELMLETNQTTELEVTLLVAPEKGLVRVSALETLLIETTTPRTKYQKKRIHSPDFPRNN